jgi:hypothetical protein
MDEQLKLALDNPDFVKVAGMKLTVMDGQRGEIECQGPRGAVRHVLKPLAELYGKGTGLTSVDRDDRRFMVLLMGIELAVLQFYCEDPSLTDGLVELSLRRLAIKPEIDPASDELARRVQLRLRFVLSLCDLSRQDLVLAIRMILKSVQRHTRQGGIRGYLEFTEKYLGGVLD